MVTAAQLASIRAMLQARTIYLLTGDTPTDEELGEMWDAMEEAFGVLDKEGPACTRLRQRVASYLFAQPDQDVEYYIVSNGLNEPESMIYN